MEFRCANCQHIGPAAELRPTASGVALVCESCGHANPLEMGGTPAPAPTPAPEAAPTPEAPLAEAAPTTPAPAPSQPPAKKGEPQLSEAALARLIPEPGDGLRCPKCAHKVEPLDAHCSRCGLGLSDAARYAPGEAPWEKPPPGKEDAYEQALLLWRAAKDEWSIAHLEKLTEFLLEEGLHEVGIRWLRFHLIDYPEDELAIEQLKLLATRLQSRLIVAEAQAHANAEQFEQGVTRFRTTLLVGVGIFWTLLFAVFFSLFLKSC